MHQTSVKLYKPVETVHWDCLCYINCPISPPYWKNMFILPSRCSGDRWDCTTLEKIIQLVFNNFWIEKRLRLELCLRSLLSESFELKEVQLLSHTFIARYLKNEVDISLQAPFLVMDQDSQIYLPIHSTSRSGSTPTVTRLWHISWSTIRQRHKNMILICNSSHTWRNKRKSLSKHLKTLKGFRFLLVNQKIARALHVTLKVVTSPCAKFKGYVTLPSNFSSKLRVHTNRCIVSRRILIHVRIRSTYSTNFYDEFFA